jgi:hypothetical protein
MNILMFFQRRATRRRPKSGPWRETLEMVPEKGTPNNNAKVCILVWMVVKVIFLFPQRILFEQGSQHSVQGAGRGEDHKVGGNSGPADKGGDGKKCKNNQ